MKRIFNKITSIFEKYGLYLFALVVMVLNFSLAFDNVVWGDEAFTGNIVRNTNLYGIFQRVYYWDSHPPIYYYWVRLFSDLFGYKTSVMHFASLIPFAIGIGMAITVFRKRFGKIPAAFFVLISGLSASCVEYNLEIRMYALTFMELLICIFYSGRIIGENEQKKYWIGLTIWGVIAAYTHYYGLVISGLLLFFTSLMYFLKNRGNTWKYGVVSIVSYLALYTPWLIVMLRQMGQDSNWWLKDISSIEQMTVLMFGGTDMKQILLPFTVILSIIVFLVEFKCIYWVLPEGKNTLQWKIRVQKFKDWSTSVCMLIVLWLVIIFTFLFTYVVSYTMGPLTIPRYMYLLMPLVLYILMVCVDRILGYQKITWGKEDKNIENDQVEVLKEQKYQVYLVDKESVLWKKLVFIVISCIFVIMLGIGLMDFKYYRSVTKTQDFQTEKVLSIIGEVDEDVVFTSSGVSHLSWTVLEYYYPNNEIYDTMPYYLSADINQIWAFLGRELSEEEEQILEDNGYSIEIYWDVWMGKYGCVLYHVYK